MKLAVLLYGQPRFWDLSYKSIIQETTFDNCTTDYYFHFWNKIAYHSHDPEYELTNNDKKNIVAAYKPKNYSFTDYTLLEQACEEIFQIVEKDKKDLNCFFDKTQKTAEQEIRPDEAPPTNTQSIEDIINNVKNKHESNSYRHEERFRKSIFEATKPENLTYYLGQFVSLQEGAKLIEEEYDYIFRIRTDVLFVTPDLYKDKKQYLNDKQLFYHRLYNNEKGIFCKSGDLQIWEGAYNSHDRIETPGIYSTPPRLGATSLDAKKLRTQILGALSDAGAEEDHQPIKVTNYNSFSFKNNKLYANNPREDSGMLQKSNKSHIYNPETQYLHMKDWYIVGSGQEVLLSIKQYINTIIFMIKKSKHFLMRVGIDNNWAAGELVCGEVLGLNGINAAELGFEYYNTMIVPNRYMKIANKHTKLNILTRPHIRVRADSDIPLKDQYKKLINE